MLLLSSCSFLSRNEFIFHSLQGHYAPQCVRTVTVVMKLWIHIPAGYIALGRQRNHSVNETNRIIWELRSSELLRSERALKTAPVGCSETSVRNYYYSMCNNREKRGYNLLCGGSIKRRYAVSSCKCPSLCLTSTAIKTLRTQTLEGISCCPGCDPSHCKS